MRWPATAQASPHNGDLATEYLPVGRDLNRLAEQLLRDRRKADHHERASQVKAMLDRFDASQNAGSVRQRASPPVPNPARPASGDRGRG